ncbi:MAG: glucose-1-phosphate adenylyltransferase [Planctomycetes bacterium]|nr:glucose-1-phosphate adenylyltransferase [Planctomycetota bacterium]MBI3847414.1 glucose-1-phosphate adenylyltransferase [Planctomycetota bacterium]
MPGFVLAHDVLTLLLAGGRGERLHPLTRDRAKPAVPFGGIYRIIDFTLSNCLNSGLRRVKVLTQYHGRSIERHVHIAWNLFSHEIGEFIETVPPQMALSDRAYLGTADAIRQSLPIFEEAASDEVLVLAADHIYKMDYGELLSFHERTNAQTTVACVEVPASEASRYGILELDESGRVIGFEEKPKTPKPIRGRPDTCLASMGIYVFDRDVLVESVVRDAAVPDSHHDIGRNIVPSLVGGDAHVFGFTFADANRKQVKYWRDIGTLDAYYEANMDLIAVDPVFNLYDDEWPIRALQPQSPPAKTVFAGGETGDRVGTALDSMLSHGCIVSGGRVVRSVLSPLVRVNSYSQVEDSILFAGVHVGRYAHVRRAILDEGVIVEPHAKIGIDLAHDRERFVVSDGGIVVVPRGTEVKAD